MTVHWIRHAESAWNATGLWQGHGDPPLSGRGRAQARALARRLVPAAIEVVVASDLRRAVETAALLARAWGAELHRDERLRERALGEWTGLGTTEILARWGEDLERLRRGEEGLRPGGGETLEEVRDRVRRALVDLRGLAPRRVAVVTHGGVLTLLRPGAEMENAEAWTASLRACLARLHPGPGGVSRAAVSAEEGSRARREGAR